MPGEPLQPIFITDLDGTLLQSDARLSDFARQSIRKLLEAGVFLSVATARSATSTREILGDLPFSLPVICTNGGTIYSYEDMELHHVDHIPAHITRALIHDIKDRDDTAFVSTNTGGMEKVYYDDLTNEGMKWYHDDRIAVRDERLTWVKDIRELADEPVTTVTFMNRFHFIEKTRRYFLKRYKNRVKLNYFENKYSPGWHWLSLNSTAATKANALGKLKQITSKEAHPVVVFGDELNDLSMFSIADRAIAVGNARAELKQAAHEIIGKNTEDAVINYLLEAHKMA